MCFESHFGTNISLGQWGTFMLVNEMYLSKVLRIWTFVGKEENIFHKRYLLFLRLHALKLVLVPYLVFCKGEGWEFYVS